jgi:2-methylcitrate dehydratase PrpD
MGMHDPSGWIASARFSAHACSTRVEHLPDAAREAIKAFVLDTIGVGVGGLGSPWAAPFLAATGCWGDGHGAQVWGDGRWLPVSQAAAANAFLVHCQEFDCVHEGAVLHPLTVVLPALLAQAQQARMSGPELLAACAVGVDVAVTLGLAATSPIKFFRPATCGLFGAIAALASARKLDVATTTHAFGYGLAFASGTMQAHVEGTPALAVQVANAARSAFAAVDLAEAGLPGPKGAIDGPYGYLALFETEHQLGQLLDELGQVWRAGQVSWKPQPTGRAAHGGIDLALQLRAQSVTAEMVETLDFEVPPLILQLVGRPIQQPLDVNYARLCLPYAVAVALRTGGVGLADFTPAALADPVVHALAAKVNMQANAVSDPAAFVPQRLTASLKDGRRIVLGLDVLPGTQARPLSRQAQQAKLFANLAFGLGETATASALGAALIEHCDQLEALDDVAVMARLTVGDAR